LYSDRWSPGLRQGDVLGEISLPSLGAELKVVTTTRSLIDDVTSSPLEHVLVPASPRYVVVVSHDCEFNESKRNRLLVARIESAPGNLSPEQLDDLRESNDVRARASAGKDVAGVDSFLLAPVRGAFTEERVAVFTTITPLPMKMKAGLVGAKRAEMRHEQRVLFREKLAWFFGRIADDIGDEHKSDAPTARQAEPSGRAE
jgi:hypothetical protein